MRSVDEYFGLCPHCHQQDGWLDIGKSHWIYCKEHRVKWCIGSNLFSSWRQQTEEEQRQIYDDLGFGEFQEIRPYFLEMGDQLPAPPENALDLLPF
jgi:hypothetical protein